MHFNEKSVIINETGFWFLVLREKMLIIIKIYTKY